MDTIERKVRLPAGAKPIDQYARAYAFTSNGEVVAAYFRPDTHYLESSCRGAKSYGPKNGQIALSCPPPDGVRPNERRWFASEYLPFFTDGGCDYIEIEYSLKSDTVINARCHAEA